MFGLFGKKNESGLPGPRDVPELAGRYMVVEEKKDPNYVWTLKSVSRPISKKEYYCRVFDEAKAVQAGVQVKEWTSLDGHTELILWEGYCNKETNLARREKAEIKA